ncbi:glutamate racemase [Pseudomonadota bacterium]
MPNNAPIGIFDSGVGGLSVLKEIRQRLPRENLIYLADSAFAPYGEKSPEVIIDRSHYCSDWLIGQGAKAVVVACNTATAAAVHSLRESLSVPVIAMEPAVKPAVSMSKQRRVGVLATSGTLLSEKFATLQRRHANGAEVITQPCPGLVEEIEKGDLDSPQLTQLLERYVGALVAQGVDVIVLGCTHYPLVRVQIDQLLPADVWLIDSGAAVAQRVELQLQHYGLYRQSQGDVSLTCVTSGGVLSLKHALKQWLNMSQPVTLLDDVAGML